MSDEEPRRGTVVTFSRYETLDSLTAVDERRDRLQATHQYTMDALAYEAFHRAWRESPFDVDPFTPKRKTWRQWLRWTWEWRVRPWVPHVHLGPCDHSDCDNC